MSGTGANQGANQGTRRSAWAYDPNTQGPRENPGRPGVFPEPVDVYPGEAYGVMPEWAAAPIDADTPNSVLRARLASAERQIEHFRAREEITGPGQGVNWYQRKVKKTKHMFSTNLNHSHSVNHINLYFYFTVIQVCRSHPSGTSCRTNK